MKTNHLVFGAASLALLFAGCGGDNGNGGSTGSTGSTAGTTGSTAGTTGSTGSTTGSTGSTTGTTGTTSGLDLSVLVSTDMTINNPINPAGLGPAPVDIGDSANLATAGAYVLLAKAAITNATGSLITGGHVGLSPDTATSITGFNLMEDASTVFATSSSVAAPGKVYAAKYTAPTPANLTAAVHSMETAYVDAAGRQPPDHINLSSGNLGGLTLAPGLYNWGSTVTIPADVTLAGGANDVWIFQISGDLDLSSAKHVILSGGAQAKNIFWAVAGQATIHVNAHFEGIILTSTAVTIQTTASFHGRVLAQTMIAIDNNAITAP